MTGTPGQLMQRSDSIQTNSSDSLPTAKELSSNDVTPIIPDNENHTIITSEPESLTASTGRKILLCYDNKNEASIAWDWVEADVKKEDRVVIISILPVTAVDAAFTADYGLGTGIGLGSAYSITLEENLNMLRKLRANITATLEEKCKPLAAKCSGVSIHVVHGDPRYAIPRCADYHKCDIIVLGRRNLTGWQRFTSSGSVSTHVSAHATQTVVIAKA